MGVAPRAGVQEPTGAITVSEPVSTGERPANSADPGIRLGIGRSVREELTMKNFWIFTIIAALALSLGACSGDKQSAQTAQQPATEHPVAQAPPPAAQTPVEPKKEEHTTTPAPAPAPTRTTKVDVPAQPAQPTMRMVPLPAGTVFEASLDETISTETHQGGRAFTATVTKPATIEGVGAVVPTGSKLRGEVTRSKRSGRVGGKAEMAIEFRELTTADGKSYPIFADPLLLEGEGQGGNDAARVVGSTIGGAVIGGLLGGKKGATQGAVAGAAGGTIWAVATRGGDIVLDPGQAIQVTLQREIRIQAMVPGGTQLP